MDEEEKRGCSVGKEIRMEKAVRRAHVRSRRERPAENVVGRPVRIVFLK